MERETGIEPATSSLGSWHSTAELLPLSKFDDTIDVGEPRSPNRIFYAQHEMPRASMKIPKRSGRWPHSATLCMHSVNTTGAADAAGGIVSAWEKSKRSGGRIGR